MITIKEMKEQLKTLAALIRKHRREFKDAQRTNTVSWSADYWKVRGESEDFRYKHIAYCLARGRKYEEIESKVHDGNAPKWDKINAILATITPREVPSESQTLCASAV